MANVDLKIDTLTAEVRSIIRMLTAKTTNEEINKTESQILKAYPLKTETDLVREERRLSTDVNYKNNLVSIIFFMYILQCFVYITKE